MLPALPVCEASPAYVAVSVGRYMSRGRYSTEHDETEPDVVLSEHTWPYRNTPRGLAKLTLPVGLVETGPAVSPTVAVQVSVDVSTT